MIVGRTRTRESGTQAGARSWPSAGELPRKGWRAQPTCLSALRLSCVDRASFRVHNWFSQLFPVLAWIVTPERNGPFAEPANHLPQQVGGSEDRCALATASSPEEARSLHQWSSAGRSRGERATCSRLRTAAPARTQELAGQRSRGSPRQDTRSSRQSDKDVACCS